MNKYYKSSFPEINSIFSKLSAIALILAFSLKAIGQETVISGTVINESNSPLAGVSVKLKGSNKGTATDANGNFSISVTGSASLIFSSIGYQEQEVRVGNQKTLSIKLVLSDKQLEQVVVTGYGTQRKRDVTGAISNVKGSELSKQPVLTATQGLQGKVAGVQIISSGSPNSAPLVRIRGTGSILAGVNPLYVVDGVLTDDIRNINTSDILSVDILKDASSGSIYGVRASNGVIIITTKKGRSGRMIISYDANVGMRQAAHLVKMANSKQYATYINEASINTGNGSILVDPSLTGTSTDWFGTILHNSFEQSHNISLSGGSDKVNYFLSIGYLTDEGIVIANTFKRFTLRSNNEYKLSDKLKINTLISYSRGTTQDVNLGTAYNNAYHAAPIIASKVNGRYGNTSAYQNVGNPLLDIENNNNKYLENRFQGTGSIDYKPISSLTLHSSIGAELGLNTRRTYNYQFLNDTATFITPGGNQKNPTSSLSVTDERNTRWVWDNTVTYQKSFGSHDITILAGTTAEKLFNDMNSGSRNNVPSDPNLWYLSAGDDQTQHNNSATDEWTRNSYLARVNYAYDKKYLFTGTFRADGTSVFNTHWGYFPSIGLGWVLSNERFLSNQKIFNSLKLRGSYGSLGNDNIPSSAHIQTLTTGLGYFFNGSYVPGGAFLDIIDKNIHWETTREGDIGIEFATLHNRLTGEIDVYDKKVKDALIQVPIPKVLGDPDALLFTNVASIENKGIELSLNWNGRIRKKVNYTLSGNISFNHNNVICLNGGQPIYSGNVGSKGTTTLTSNGYAIGSFYVLQAESVFHNQAELAAYVTKNGIPITINGQLPTLGDLKYTDVNGDGKIDDNDRVFSGSYQPKVILGLNIGVSYKSFDLSLAAYSQLGGKIYNGKKAARFNQKDNVEASVADNRWTFTNYASNVPRANLNALPASTYFIESGDFVRINNLTLGYTFSKTRLNKYGITNFRVFIMSQNLATFTKYSGFSPEISDGGPLSPGIEYNAYPTTRTFAFGLNLTL